MSVTEVMQTFNDIKSNWLAGSFIVFYYALIYWPRLKEGLSLGKKPRVNLDRVEQRYKILKLKIEIEDMKEASSIPEERLLALEKEVLLEARTDKEKLKKKGFNTVQKFVAIPLIIFTFLIAIPELMQGENPEAVVDTLLGGVLVVGLIVVAFWGIPKLIKSPPNAMRTTGFILFWSITFFVALYFLSSIIDSVILSAVMSQEVKILSHSDNGGLYLLGSLVVAITLGVMGKLPKMQEYDKTLQMAEN
jgi:uncharacterized membrane protein (DUF106 family)